jgi:aspartyl-tRNA(Asn)/glutamyl-tRNA(Gln) amidotransferase subunit A
VLAVELHELTAHEISGLLQRGETSAVEVTEALLRRIEETEPHLRAYLTVTAEIALEQARAADARLRVGSPLSALDGVPLAIKDILCTKGVRTTCASKILENFVPPYDATVISLCRKAGTVWLGKTNLDEFAMGSSTENSAFGPTRNPWDLERVPGGSSGGSAAAVAANAAVLSLGTDTGGSIRQPASLCGIVGLKPTYGRVSRFGLIAYASSLDQVGPITKDVTDCALLMAAISGHDPRDSTSVPVAVPDFRAALAPDVAGLRIGIPREFFEHQGAKVDAEVAQAIHGATRKMEEMGARCEEVSLPHMTYMIPVYYVLAPAEASSNLARYDGVAYGFRAPGPHADIVEMFSRTRDQGFGQEVKRRIMLGTYALSAGYYDAYYQKAQQVRTLIKQDFDRAFERFDLLFTPTSPTVAFEIGAKTEDPLAMYLSDVGTIPVNLAGLPAISLPAGFQDGLPIGLQIIGKPFDEATILRAAFAFEQATDFHRRRSLPAGPGCKALVARG